MVKFVRILSNLRLNESNLITKFEFGQIQHSNLSYEKFQKNIKFGLRGFQMRLLDEYKYLFYPLKRIKTLNKKMESKF